MRYLYLVLCLTTLGFAQDATHSSSSPSQQRSVPDGTRISVELKNTLNAKRVKVGDPVRLEVAADVRGVDDKVLIPAGAKLFGRVSVAVPYSKQSGESQLSIVVERAEWKKGTADLNGFIVRGPRQPPRLGTADVPIGTGYDVLVLGEAPAPGPIPNIPLPGGQVDPRRAPLTDVELRVADDPKVGSVLISEKKDVVLESGTTFVIRHIIVRDK